MTPALQDGDAGVERVREIAPHFAISGRWHRAAPHGSGHIHDTFVAEYDVAGTRTRFLHQRINTGVFRDPEGLMQNVERVTNHLRAALERAAAADVERRCLRVIPTREGRPLYVDGAGDSWRTYAFVEAAHSCDTLAHPAQAYRAASAFGAFLSELADLDPGTLVETIPGFHDLDGRITALEDALRADACGRAAGVDPEIGRAREVHVRVARELAVRDFEAAPRRVVHNDCKINNVLFDDASGEALCVIDLDTVMEGSVLCDFGDLVRTAACPAAEDERDLSKVRFDAELFRALASGFVSGAGPLLTAAERRLLPLAGAVLTLENAIRFLTDHLRGDVYFRTQHTGHNLERCRAQLRLLEHLLDALADLDRIVEDAGG